MKYLYYILGLFNLIISISFAYYSWPNVSIESVAYLGVALGFISMFEIVKMKEKDE